MRWGIHTIEDYHEQTHGPLPQFYDNLVQRAVLAEERGGKASGAKIRMGKNPEQQLQVRIHAAYVRPAEGGRHAVQRLLPSSPLDDNLGEQ